MKLIRSRCRRFGGILAVVALLALPGTVAAQSAVTLTVTPTITLTGVPLTLTFGTIVSPAANLQIEPTEAAPLFTWASSDALGKLTVVATDLTSTVPVATIAKTAFTFGYIDGATNVTQSVTRDMISKTAYSGTSLVLGTQTAPGIATGTYAIHIMLPSNSHSGAYTGTLTFSVT